MTVKIVRKDGANIAPEDTVKYLDTGKFVHEKKSLYINHKANILKKDKDTYINRKTGEIIKNVKKSTKKFQNPQSQIRSYINLRYTIEKYVTGSIYNQMYTLTYNNNQTSFKQLSHDFVTFMKRLKRYVKKDYPKVHLSWIRINEPHEQLVDGKPTWHIHLIVVGLPYIKQEKLQELWGHGEAYIKSYYKCDVRKVVNYFTGFVNPSSPDTKNKRPRLKYYTSGTDLFSLSRGLYVPKWKTSTDKEVRQQHPGEIINERTIDLISENNNQLVNSHAFRDIKKLNKKIKYKSK